jgi:DNA-binding response OmpR family regulator
MATRQAPSILIIDDDPDILSLFKIIISRVGYQVSTASSAQEAMRLLALPGRSPQTVLVDLLLGDDDGLKVCAAARERLGPNARVLAMTADPEAFTETASPWADALILKPFDFEDLLRRLKAEECEPQIEAAA